MSEHCPTCSADLSKDKPIKPTIPLQEWFDSVAQPEYKATLLSGQEACERVGWIFQDKPECCGEPVKISGFLGAAYHAECKKCQKWIRDVTVQTGNSWMAFTPDDVICDTPYRWITSVR